MARINFDNGEFIGVIGPFGSGKTTLLRSTCAVTSLRSSTVCRVDRFVGLADSVSRSEGDGGQRLRAGELQSPLLQPSPRR